MTPFESPREGLDYRRVARAITFLDAHYAEQPRLAEVAEHVGLSEGHLQRLFTHHVGISPKRFLQQCTARRARELLQSEASVLEAAAAVGLSGGGRLHDLMLATERLTPGQVKATQDLLLRYGVTSTPLGPLLVVGAERGVCAVHFLDGPLQPSWLDQRWPGARWTRDDAVAAPVAARVFPEGEPPTAPLAVLLRGTHFQLQVWCALLTIPRGSRTSYGALAHALGRPSGARAVARAVGDNPIASLIPCHRVVRNTGALGGYRWGLERKQVLLAREHAPSSTA